MLANGTGQKELSEKDFLNFTIMLPNVEEQNAIADLLITADTIVWLDSKVYGKPADETEAHTMLRALSGKTHDVITGVCVRTNQKNVSFASTTKVRFAHLTDDEIAHYINKYRPMDKAGSYGVQEWIGYIGVEHIEGSYFNVMGLPIQKLYTVLKEF